jgi:glycosyltransferase involved in cell wall biosynthesis
MTKVLVLSYFFPPCSLTASNRVFGIVSNMHRFGLYPIVITRQWDNKSTGQEDLLKSTKKTIEHLCYEGYEVYYIPYRSSLRDRLLLHSDKIKFFRVLSKILTLIYLILEPFTNLVVPFSNIYSFSKKYLGENKDIKFMLVSGNPFVLFKFGYKLKKKFSIHWIADYRDSWTTNRFAMGVRGFNKYLYKLYRFYEKKWVNTAALFTSVSDHYVHQIQGVVTSPGYTIYNGFIHRKYCKEFSDSDSFNILYSGTLYYNQPIEEFLHFLAENKFIIQDKQVHLYFAGLGFDKKQTKRVIDLVKGYEKQVHILPWDTQEAYNQIQNQMDLLLLLPYQGFKGIPTSKLFDYVSTAKNILLYKSDADVMASILQDSGLGFVANDTDDAYTFISTLIKHKHTKSSFLKVEEEKIETYSILRQTKILSQLIKKEML